MTHVERVRVTTSTLLKVATTPEAALDNVYAFRRVIGSNPPRGRERGRDGRAQFMTAYTTILRLLYIR